MKCISFNINSVRARPHQLIHLRDNLDPDVIGLQETKVDDPEFPMEEINEIGYHAELCVITNFINFLHRKFRIINFCFLKAYNIWIKVISKVNELMRPSTNAINIK